jgi:hypothetical protein
MKYRCTCLILLAIYLCTGCEQDETGSIRVVEDTFEYELPNGTEGRGQGSFSSELGFYLMVNPSDTIDVEVYSDGIHSTSAFTGPGLEPQFDFSSRTDIPYTDVTITKQFKSGKWVPGCINHYCEWVYNFRVRRPGGKENSWMDIHVAKFTENGAQCLGIYDSGQISKSIAGNKTGICHVLCSHGPLAGQEQEVTSGVQDLWYQNNLDYGYRASLETGMVVAAVIWGIVYVAAKIVQCGATKVCTP